MDRTTHDELLKRLEGLKLKVCESRIGLEEIDFIEDFIRENVCDIDDVVLDVDPDANNYSDSDEDEDEHNLQRDPSLPTYGLDVMRKIVEMHKNKNSFNTIRNRYKLITHPTQITR
jgi:hypothetical protein